MLPALDCLGGDGLGGLALFCGVSISRAVDGSMRGRSISSLIHSSIGSSGVTAAMPARLRRAKDRVRQSVKSPIRRARSLGNPLTSPDFRFQFHLMICGMQYKFITEAM